MKIKFNSISFKTIFPILTFFSVFVFFIVYISQAVFSSAYIELEKEKVGIIEKSIHPSLSLNLSYGFKSAVTEIAQNTLQNEHVLLLQITDLQTQKVQIFTRNKSSIAEHHKNKELFLQTQLLDPLTEQEIGKLTLVYSNATYKEYMKEFNTLLFIGVGICSFFILVASSLLYNALKKLTILDTSLQKFNPKNPQKLHLNSTSNDEIASIVKSANFMIENIVHFLNESKEMTQKLFTNETHLKEAQKIAKIGSFDYDFETKELTLSEEYYNILELEPATSLSYETFFNFISWDDYARVMTALEGGISNVTAFEINYAIESNKGTVIHLLTKVKIESYNGEVIKLVGVSMDVSAQVYSQKMIEKLAYYDSLTGLANRALLKDRIHKSLQCVKRTQEKMAILFLDLDHFKLINDNLGHSVGDELLVHVSHILKNSIRESDTLSRIGGDEFIILLPSIKTKDDAHFIALKILAQLQKKHLIGTHELYITSSIGIALYPDDGEDTDTLMRNADTAMYAAKHDGRNNFQFYEKSMGSHVDKKLHLEQDLVEAVKSEEQIEVYYQPKVFADKNTIAGAEALVRWRHPKDGLIFPDEFIYIAETTGLMIELGNIITEQAIKQLKEWITLGYSDFVMAINLSARQFQDENLVFFISQMIKKYNVNPKNLEFEITESISMKNVDKTLKILTQLKAIGVSIAIDDFGTGHSSLAYLKKFPIDTLKIDRSFVCDLATNEDDRVIAQTIISMAISLGLKTVAEGVETKVDTHILYDMKCDLLQGYHFSKPVSHSDFTNYLKEHHKLN